MADCALFQHITIATEFLTCFPIHLSARIKTGVYIIYNYKQPRNTTNMVSLRKYLLFVKAISEDWKLACGIYTQGSTALTTVNQLRWYYAPRQLKCAKNGLLPHMANDLRWRPWLKYYSSPILDCNADFT